MKKTNQNRKLFWIIVGIELNFLVGFADFLSGYELSFSLFYLIPVCFASWFLNKQMGILMCIVSTATWFIIDSIGGHVYSSSFIPYWNAGIRFCFFSIIAYLLPTLKELAIEKGVSRIDPLTGAFNRRYLDEILEYEIVRLSRTNKFFTLIYFDLDGFKKVNDSKGHHVGDQILCATVFCIKNKLRKTDIISRVGGDEFIIVLFDINEDSVNSAVEKLRNEMLNEMSLNNWPITFSMGAVSCYSSSISSDDLIKKADGLMYSVKKNGKNNIAYNIIKN